MIALLPVSESLTIVAAFVCLFLFVLAVVIWDGERKRTPRPVPDAQVTPASWYRIPIEDEQ